jgi:hypothetical protein
MLLLLLFYMFVCRIVFSSPEPKVQGKLLVSKGDTPASIVRRDASTIIFFCETDGQMYFKFGL